MKHPTIGTPACRDSVEVPAYLLHQADLALIRAAAAWLRMDLLEFVQIAPYLYAQDLLRSQQKLEDAKKAGVKMCPDCKHRYAPDKTNEG